MKLIKQDPIAMGMLGRQAIQDHKYRLLTYVLTVEEGNNIIYNNLLTHEMIAVNLSELELPETRNYFIENWFLVPEEHDDQQLVDECREVLALMNSWPKKNHIFHIYTTLDCNARCFYCFEKRVSGSNMTLETASRVIDFMKEQADGMPIKIEWFGGEPLLNYPIIDFISAGLRQKKLQFDSDMISNGFLFDNVLIERAKKFWNLKKVQITLDGTRQVYKEIKAYVNDVTDPFERVLQNIKTLLRAQIRVSIRLNIGLHNYDDIGDLTDFLCVNFKGEDKINVYVSPLIEVKEYTDENKEFIYDCLDGLNSKLNLYFRNQRESELSGTIANGYCMATGREAVTILPDGKVGICTGVTYDALLGDIYTKEFDDKVREEFGRRFYQEDKCRPCPMYPCCYFASGCPNYNGRDGCDSIRVQSQIRSIKENMKSRCRLDASDDGKRFAQ